ncbi:apolipoprotein D [Leptinotarsa decemlineata]|uniref:apolipoprotein D n=1 Tax=Leptinotarsa decemlineata TaxID=7539 RepID=UPI003D30B964
MTSIIFSFVLAVININYASAQIPSLGKCPPVEVVQHFNVEKYLGKWYEQEKYPTIFEIGGKCVTAEYSANPNGTVKVFNKQINILTGNPSSIIGNARLDSDSGEAKLLVRFPSVPFQLDAPYWVLDTDYRKYSVVWSCFELGPFSARVVWILTRDRQPSRDIMEKAYGVLKRQNVSKAFLMKNDQKDCPAE